MRLNLPRETPPSELPGSLRRVRRHRGCRLVAALFVAVLASGSIAEADGDDLDALVNDLPNLDNCGGTELRRPSTRVAGGASVSRSDADKWVAAYSALRAEYYLDEAVHLLDIALSQVSACRVCVSLHSCTRLALPLGFPSLKTAASALPPRPTHSLTHSRMRVRTFNLLTSLSDPRARP